MKLAVFFALLASPLFLAETSAYRFVCYYGSWSVYRQGPGKFRVEDIDPYVCTHIVYTFGGIDYDGRVKALDPWNDIGDEWHEGAFTKLQRLRGLNPKLKLIFAVGGWNEGSEKYSRVMADPNLRRTFVQSALNFTKTYKFDGFDLDWEYPGFRGGKPGDRENFSQVLKELSEVFRPNGLMLTAAVSANALNIGPSYDCVTISKYLSFINVMTYDLHGSWEKVTGHHTAMYKHPSDSPADAHLNVDTAIRAWLNCGATPGKLNIGVASYGRTFTLADPRNHGIGALSTGPGPAGNFVPENGFLPYNEICWEQKQNLWTKYYEPTQQVPYAVKNNIWVGYDDPESIVKKVKLAKTLRLGGVMIWSIETDDFRGNCGLGKNPLLTAIKAAMRELPEIDDPENIPEDIPEVIPPSPPDVPEEPEVPPTDDDNYDYKCKSLGQLFKHPKDCTTFFMCTYKGDAGQFKAVRMQCPPGLVFDEAIMACNFQSDNCPLF